MLCVVLIIVFLSPFSATSNEIMLHDVADLQWKNRVLLILAEDRPNNNVEALTDEINDRDIVWFVFLEKSVISNYPGKIADDFLANTKKKYFSNKVKVILIGKDGSVKNRYRALDMISVFQSIDAMPMRQSEMRNSQTI